MRLFLAVYPGEQFVAGVTTALDGWQGKIPIKWIRPENWHLTLQFLGDWPEDRLTDLTSALNRMTVPSTFTLEPGKLSGFPDLTAPRVLFLQLKSNGQVDDLAESVRNVVQDVWPDGPQDPRPFYGHLTLARVRARLQASQLTKLQNMELGQLAAMPVDGFSLVVSQLLSSGPVYRKLAFFKLELS